MHRQTVYSGQLARNADFLLAQQNTMVALAKLSAGVLGATTIVNNFTVTPTGPASLNVILTPGEVYQLENLEQSTWSSLATDSHTILKQGILLDPLTFGITPPGTVGYSQAFLIEVQYQDLDTGSLVLPYYNAAAPTLPFSGPGNAGTAQNTVRQGIVAAQVKAGIAATTGTQVTPTADAGWTGIYIVTVANGATTITAGNISVIATAPFIPCTLPNVPITSQSGVWRYAPDTGTINNVVVTLNPIPTQYTTGMSINVKMANIPTGASVINCNALGNKSIVKPGGAALSGREWNVGDMVELRYDGINFQISSSAKQSLTANTTIYVNGGTGSDTLYDGTAATVTGSHGPLATLQAAVNLAFSYAPSQYNITIQVAAGTYTGTCQTPLYAGPTLIINGAGASTTTLNAGNGFGFSVQGGNTMTVQNIGGSNTVSAGGPALFNTGSNSTMTTSNTSSGAVGNGVFEVQGPGFMQVGTHTFAGNCQYMFYAIIEGYMYLTQSAVFTFSTPITCTYVANVGDLGILVIPSPAPTFPSAANLTSGQKYLVAANSVLSAQSLGTSYLPGPTAGAVSNGGVYIP